MVKVAGKSIGLVSGWPRGLGCCKDGPTIGADRGKVASDLRTIDLIVIECLGLDWVSSGEA